MPSRPSPGSYPGPVQVPSRVRGGPVQIRHVLCFTVFRTHPGPEVGAIPARPGPILLPSVPYRIGPGRAETDFLATSEGFPQRERASPGFLHRIASPFRVSHAPPLTSHRCPHRAIWATQKAKSGNLNLFLRILPFFSLKIAGKTREKRAKCPEKGLDYQILPFRS